MRWLIRLYQRYISPYLPARCRFAPTCSEYTVQAIDRFGVWRGLVLGTGRILRCHPWGECGPDPVPDEFSWAAFRGRAPAAESDDPE